MGTVVIKDGDVHQTILLLKTLRKAQEHLKRADLDHPERTFAIASISAAISMLENPRRNRRDLETTDRTFLQGFTPQEGGKIKEVLEKNGLAKLSMLAARKPVRLEHHFRAANLDVPLVFLRVSEAYQAVIKAEKSVHGLVPVSTRSWTDTESAQLP